METQCNWTWSYLGGLTDGEGCIGLYLNLGTKESYSFTPTIQIANHSKLSFFFDSLKEWLKQQDISSNISKNKTCLVISSWKGVEKFCNKIYTHVILKREEISLMLKAINIRNSAPRRGLMIDYRTIRTDLLTIAHQIQSFKSKKGKTKRYIPIKDQINNFGYYNK